MCEPPLKALFALALLCTTGPIANAPAPRPVAALDDGLARTPPMGWRTWNAFMDDVDQPLMEVRRREIGQI